MTRDEAIAAAERYVGNERLTVGPVFDVRYFSGEEYLECEVKPPPHWCVYFAYTGPSREELNEHRKGLLSGSYDEPTIVIVDDEDGETKLFSSL